MKFKTLEVAGLRPAIQGMRAPLKSWAKSDTTIQPITEKDIGKLSDWEMTHNKIEIGPNDLKLMCNLVEGGAEHRKFLRMIQVWVEITAPSYWLAELDTYHVATTRNSISLQHTGAKRDFELTDFELDINVDSQFLDDNSISMEALRSVLNSVNKFRQKYIETGDYRYFRWMRQLLPSSFNYTIVYQCNYETILNMYQQRRYHKLKEWSGREEVNVDGTFASFVTWAESLPFFKEICLLPLKLI